MKNKPVMATLSLLFLVFSIYAGMLLLMDSDTDLRGQAAQIPTISLQTDENTYPTNINFAVTVNLDTSGEPVDSVQAIIDYDPTHMEALSIRPQPVFQNQQVLDQSIDHSQGKVKISLAPEADSPPESLSGQIAIVVFRGISETGEPTQISFNPQTKATLAGKPSILTNLGSTSILIKP